MPDINEETPDSRRAKAQAAALFAATPIRMEDEIQRGIARPQKRPSI